MKLLYIISTIFVTNTLASQWIDPHDMNTNAKQKYMKPPLKKSFSTSSVDEQIVDVLPEICASYLKRIVAVLMNSAHIDKRDPEIYHGHIRFNLNPNEFDFLANFGKEDISLDRLRKLDTIINGSFKRTFIDEYMDTIETFQLKLYSLVVNIHNLWLLGAACLIYVVYQLIKNDFSFAYILKYLTIIIFIVDFGFRYHHLLEEAEEHNVQIIYSKECDTQKMSWSEWSKFVFSSKDCGKKTVTPLDAFLYQIKNLIIVPMHAFGTGMGGFGKNMFTTLPWGLNLILWPIMLIFTLILLLFLMTIITGQSIEFNILHMLKFKFGGGRKERTVTGPTVEQLVDKINHRPMVQNVYITPEGKKNDVTQSDVKVLEQGPSAKPETFKDSSKSTNTVYQVEKNSSEEISVDEKSENETLASSHTDTNESTSGCVAGNDGCENR